MNTKHFYLSALMGICCLTACSIHEMDIDQPLAQPPREGEALTFYADIEENDPNTRTTAVVMENGVTVQHWWNPGDSLNIFYGNMLDQSGSKFKATTQEVSQTTNFTGTLGAFVGVAEGGSSQTHYFWATYPYSEDNRSDGNSVLMTMPAQQEIPIDSWDPASDLYVARSRGLNLYFYLVGTGVRFTVTQPGIARIDFRANGDNAPALAGTVRVAFGDDNKPYVTEVVSDASPVVRVTPKDGACFVPGQYYYVHFLPGTLADGLSVTYYDLDGIPAKYPINSSLQLQRKEIHTLDGKDADLVFAVPNDQIWYKTTDGQALDIADYTSVPGESGWFILTPTHPTQPKIMSVEYALFKDQPRLQDVSLPRSVTSIDEYAFANCSALETIVLPAYNDPSGYFCISMGAFIGCTSLRSVEFPEIWSLDGTSGYDVFTDCPALTYVSGGHTTSDNHAVVFDGIMELFAGGQRTSYTIPAGVSGLGDDLFKDNTALTSIVIPEGVNSIGWYALANMTGLTELTLPGTITSIGKHAFDGCSNLTKITIESTTPPSLGGGAFDGSECDIYVPSGKRSEYLAKSGWSSYEDRIFESVYQITYTTTDGESIRPKVTEGPGWSFVNNDTYGVLKFSGPVKNIPAGAFAGLTTLKSIDIPDTVESIGYVDTDDASYYNPFFGCSNLETFTGKFATTDGKALIQEGALLLAVAPAGLDSYAVPAGVMTIGGGAFRSCNIPSISLPSTLTRIEGDAFWNCTVQGLTIPESVTEIVPVRALAGSNLLSVKFLNPEPVMPYVITGRGNLFNAETPACVIIVPDEGLQAYKSAWTAASSKIVPASAVIYYQTQSGEATTPASVYSVMYGNLSAFCELIQGGYNTADNYGFLAYDKSIVYITHLFRKADITSVTLPSKLTEVGSFTFENCDQLTSVDIPDSVEQIEQNAFYQCSNLTRFTGRLASDDGRCLIVNNKVVAFLPAGLTSYTFPEGVTAVNGDYDTGTALKSLTFPEGITALGDDGLPNHIYGPAITDIRFPSTLRWISCTFGCPALEKLTIPEGVTFIRGLSLGNLVELTLQGSTPPALASGALSVGNENYAIRVPSDAVDTYKSNSYWQPYQGHITGASTQIKIKVATEFASNEEYQRSYLRTLLKRADYVVGSTYDPVEKEITINYSRVVDSFNKLLTKDGIYADDQYRHLIREITLPIDVNNFVGAVGVIRTLPSLQRIVSPFSPDGKGIVANGTLWGVVPNLTSYVIPESATAINDGVFQSRPELCSVTFHDNITSIGWYAFANTGLTGGIDLPYYLETLGTEAFKGCTGLTAVRYGPYLEAFSAGTFMDCTSLVSVTAKDADSRNYRINRIGDSVFRHCGNLTTLTHHPRITEIGRDAFALCSSLPTYALTWVTKIGSGAFSGCSSLVGVGVLNAGLEEIPDSAFAGTALTKVFLPEGLTTIGSWAFMAMDHLTYVYIPWSVSNIGEGAFRNCENLKTVEFDGMRRGVMHFGDSVFENCMSLREINLPYTTDLRPKMFKNCYNLSSVKLSGTIFLHRETFANCVSLTELYLSENMGQLYDTPFEGCINLKNLYFYGKSPWVESKGAFLSGSGIKIHVKPEFYVDFHGEFFYWAEKDTNLIADM